MAAKKAPKKMKLAIASKAKSPAVKAKAPAVKKKSPAVKKKGK